MERDKQIAKEMLRYYYKCREVKDSDLEFLPFVVNNPNAYLLGVIYNQGMSSDYTWQIPEFLKERLGHLDIRKIAEINTSYIETIFGQKPALHRYWKTMARYAKHAAEHLVKNYNAEAINIWNDNPDVETLYARLLDFKGIGPKKANMAIRALALYFQVPIRNLEKIDIPVDVHVRRIFQRTGFSQSDKTEEIIKDARKIHPHFPAELDLPSWLIGRRWCHSQNPDCSNCVLVDSCRKIVYQAGNNSE